MSQLERLDAFIVPSRNSPAGWAPGFKHVVRPKILPVTADLAFVNNIQAVLMVTETQFLVISQGGEVFVFEDNLLLSNFETSADCLVQAFVTESRNLLCVFDRAIVIYDIYRGVENKVEIFDDFIVCAMYMDTTQRDCDFVATAFDDGEWFMWFLDGTIEGPHEYTRDGDTFAFYVNNRFVATVCTEQSTTDWYIAPGLTAKTKGKQESIDFCRDDSVVATATFHGMATIQHVCTSTLSLCSRWSRHCTGV